MPLPVLQRPVTNAALRRYEVLWNDTTMREDVRNTCLVALSAVGRMEWNNGTSNVPNMRAGLYNWSNGVNCWCSVLKFAAVSGAMDPTQVQRIIDETNGPKSFGMGQVQKNMVEMLYNQVPRTAWADGADVPLGAMVYHSRFAKNNDNPIAHCTLHVGDNMIIGSWRANISPEKDPELYKHVTNLTSRGWCGDTLYTPIDIFGDMQWLSYSNGPFWDYL